MEKLHARAPIAVDPLPEADRLLTAEAVAEMIGVRVDYIWSLCRKNEIPHLCFGRVKRFRRRAVLEWLESREQGGFTYCKQGRRAT